jgi:hypothetical protein
LVEILLGDGLEVMYQRIKSVNGSLFIIVFNESGPGQT